jgi:hypothetical protein
MIEDRCEGVKSIKRRAASVGGFRESEEFLVLRASSQFRGETRPRSPYYCSPGVEFRSVSQYKLRSRQGFSRQAADCSAFA